MFTRHALKYFFLQLYAYIRAASFSFENIRFVFFSDHVCILGVSAHQQEEYNESCTQKGWRSLLLSWDIYGSSEFV